MALNSARHSVANPCPSTAATPASRSSADGSFGFRATTDVADAGEFAALLAHVRRRLGELADRVMSGDVAVAPYYMNQETPCPRCEYRCVCRFEPSTGRYRHLSPMGREGVLERVRENVDR